MRRWPFLGQSDNQTSKGEPPPRGTQRHARFDAPTHPRKNRSPPPLFESSSCGGVPSQGQSRCPKKPSYQACPLGRPLQFGRRGALVDDPRAALLLPLNEPLGTAGMGVSGANTRQGPPKIPKTENFQISFMQCVCPHWDLSPTSALADLSGGGLRTYYLHNFAIVTCACIIENS